MPNQLQKAFDAMPTTITLDLCHDAIARDNPEEYKKRIREMYGIDPTAEFYSPIVIKWIETGRGFGEYVFFQKDGKIHCFNEMDSKETVKRILCRMVDQAEFGETWDSPEIVARFKEMKGKKKSKPS